MVLTWQYSRQEGEELYITLYYLDSEEKLTSWLRPETERKISILGSKN
jgi:hypothetical protein